MERDEWAAGRTEVEDRGFETPCWVWTKAKVEGGYGASWDGRRVRGAHRISYDRHVGRIPESLDLDHLCRVRDCINPAHLEPVTRKVNLARGLNANLAKTHCPSGHEYTPDNTYVLPSRPNARYCKACRREYQARRRAARRMTDSGPSS